MTREQEIIARLKIAVGFLKDGQSFKVDSLRIGISSETEVYVTGWTLFSKLETITKEQFIEELLEIEQIFDAMISISEELKAFLLEKNIKYNLTYNYGMGAIPICSKSNKLITWLLEKFENDSI